MPHDHQSDSATDEGTTTESVVIRLAGHEQVVRYRAGDTLLETARRGGLTPPSSCEQGNCATCMAHLDAGTVSMRRNDVLTDDDLAEGYILTCQGVPTSREVVVDYDV